MSREYVKKALSFHKKNERFKFFLISYLYMCDTAMRKHIDNGYTVVEYLPTWVENPGSPEISMMNSFNSRSEVSKLELFAVTYEFLQGALERVW